MPEQYFTYTDRCRYAAHAQMPGVPAALLDSLPIDHYGEDGLGLFQTGGFCMVVSRRLANGEVVSMTQDDGFYVARFWCDDVDEQGYECGGCEGCCEGVELVRGGDFAEAWAAMSAAS